MIQDVARSFAQILSPPFRRVLLKCGGLAILLLVVAGYGLDQLLDYFVATPYGWLDTAIAVASALGIVAAAVYLMPPVTILVAGIFLDDIADLVERRYYPEDPPGRALPMLTAIRLSTAFFFVVLFVNIVALLLLLLPGINLVAFFLANAYLLSREYFELAAMRFRPADEARAMRRDNAGHVFVAGLFIAAVVSVPILNLVTPLFGAALMVHLHKRLSGRRHSSDGRLAVPP
jgi:CysZ protein